MRAVTGMSFVQFKNLLPLFEQAYQNRYQLSLSNRVAQQESRSKLSKPHERLFFILFQLKNAVTFDVLGCTFGMNGSNARKNFVSGLEVLKLALKEANLLPKQEFEDEKDLLDFLQNNKELWIDATEIPIQRPDNEQLQKDLYSGKKNGIA